MKKYNLGILGAGGIAAVLAEATSRVDRINLYATASRDAAKANAFAAKWNVAKAYGSYTSMLEDPEIDLIYIATPHSHHAEQAELCINHGKAVLCEKAFAGNAKQTSKVLSLATRNKVFITEAIWPRYMPLAKKLRELVDRKAIGQSTMLIANLGFKVDSVPRIFSPELAGGALLDLGVYPLTFAAIAYGNEPAFVNGSATLADTGLDMQDSITLQYPDSRMAVLYASALCPTDRRGIVYGTEGKIVVEDINSFASMQVLDANDRIIEQYHRETGYSGYEYELLACVQALDNGWLEHPDMPHSETLRIMQMMDNLRSTWGVHYPFD